MRKANFNPEIKRSVDSILLKNPIVVSGKMFGYPAYYINKRLFACIYEEGVGVKVPEGVANELIGKKGIVHFQPMGREKMKEWIQINRENPETYLKDTEIFETSISFVSSLGKK
ncbi:MAG: TfoX/Sxy family protein [Chloroflexi bacterium]|nr:TfoX/Sxy family protein [Chloroflexota bacterium]MBM3173656.1 TfoX/Sxy family protein [Chloroflexota bacterium]MBM4447370.1 TfoX/Sxy family protein [Chloroflexota bacterium]